MKEADIMGRAEVTEAFRNLVVDLPLGAHHHHHHLHLSSWRCTSSGTSWGIPRPSRTAAC
eukprot:4127447-Prorocentrum_lima.AAC.1